MTIDQSRIRERLIKGWLTNTPQYQPIYPAQLVAPDRQRYTVLELKDAFFSLPWASKSQSYFALEWHDPEIGASGQLTWTRLPQGFNDFSIIFDEALHEDLGESTRPKTQMLACCRILMTY